MVKQRVGSCISKKVTTHPWSTPQAIPLPNYYRIPFTARWQRFRGVFQRCVETTLEYSISNSIGGCESNLSSLRI